MPIDIYSHVYQLSFQHERLALEGIGRLDRLMFVEWLSKHRYKSERKHDCGDDCGDDCLSDFILGIPAFLLVCGE